VAAGLGLAGVAGATHLADHRFVILGYVTDERGEPRVGALVVVTRLKTGLAYRTRTEADGFYLLVVHLHDEDEGDRLAVSAGGVGGEIRARFAPRDRTTERGTRIDVRGSALLEEPAAFADTLRRYLAR
jgi:hypothetical protein